ncbi:unnamed protein product [Triticum turgidum subsp. durum]|uniref:dUTP diphosphatase n=1 Tax=Triticum turgidum subsp. durum TaxID=4567 RepID=A0A9R0QNP5_TRITD|nr:unnamed protein product [Triticum turgidum subsp. durum]
MSCPTRVIDADYHSLVGVVLFNHSEVDFSVKPGDCVVQMIVQVIANCDAGGRRGGGPRRHRLAGGRVWVHRCLNPESL